MSRSFAAAAMEVEAEVVNVEAVVRTRHRFRCGAATPPERSVPAP